MKKNKKAELDTIVLDGPVYYVTCYAWDKIKKIGDYLTMREIYDFLETERGIRFDDLEEQIEAEPDRLRKFNKDEVERLLQDELALTDNCGKEEATTVREIFRTADVHQLEYLEEAGCDDPDCEECESEREWEPWGDVGFFLTLKEDDE